MSEAKTLHEFTHDGVVYRIIEGEDGVPCVISTLNGVQIFGLPAAGWRRASITEILRQSAELERVLDVLSESGKEVERYAVRESNMKTRLARARAEGRLEGMMMANSLWGTRADDEQFVGILWDQIAAAEREMDNRREDGDVVG